MGVGILEDQAKKAPGEKARDRQNAEDHHDRYKNKHNRQEDHCDSDANDSDCQTDQQVKNTPDDLHGQEQEPQHELQESHCQNHPTED